MRLLAILLALLIPASLPAAAPGTDVHQVRAERWLERHGHDPAAPPTLELLLRESFAHARLGIFDVMLPPDALADDEWLPDLRDALQALLDVQLEWIDWLPPERGVGAPPGGLSSDARTLARWIEGLRTKAFADERAVRGGDLLELSGATSKTREAGERLAGYMLGGGPVGSLEKPREPAGVILVPRRADFVEFLAVVGLLELRHRPFFWVDGTSVWTRFDFDGNRVVALQFATPDAESDYTRAIPMDAKNPRTLAEQVAHLGTRSLLEAQLGAGLASGFEPGDEAALATGLANEVVLSLFGEVDTRVDGDTGSRSTEAVNVFVAGGNPSGGTIANSAESRWRETHGADRFLGPLKRSQKAAAGEAQERWARPGGFELLDATGSSSHVVWAPLLGAHGTGPPPAPYHADHMEFRRAYRVAFLHWLRTRGAGSKKSSAEAFARFARTLAGGASAAEAIEEGYGLPLSAPSPEELLAADTLPLEGRFLVWLSKQ